MSPEIERLVQWALAEHERQKRPVPTVLHSDGNREDDPTTMDRDVARGLPFSKSFERYLSGGSVRTPVRRALDKMHSHSRRQSDEYRVAHALVVRGDPSVVTGLHPSVVLRSLSTLKTLSDAV